MNCALCKSKLNHLFVSCFDAESGRHLNICFECANTYFEKYPDKKVNDIAKVISSDLNSL